MELEETSHRDKFMPWASYLLFLPIPIATAAMQFEV
jgi:hypothetical protein